MKVHLINVPMCARGSVTIDGDTEQAHKGIWFCDPSLHKPEAGDIVVFANNCEVYASGLVHGLVRPEDYPKFCSGVNSWGFVWHELQESDYVRSDT